MKIAGGDLYPQLTRIIDVNQVKQGHHVIIVMCCRGKKEKG